MSAPATNDELLSLVRKSGLIDEKRLDEYLAARRGASAVPGSPKGLADLLVRDGLLTRFQANQLLQGKSRGFLLGGKYKLLEHVGSGGMGSVYLCEHIAMRRRVAVKVLPLDKAKDSSYLERFYREARAVAALDHPNIVRAHDIVQDDKLHFLVMEYVDGSSLQEIIAKSGPLDVQRAAHYLSQAAWGLQHAHEAGLVHRDIKPANLLIDRAGTVKLLDMGLARFFHDDDNLSKRYDETVLGTSDYLAPEQALSSDVDIRADIYSLGATFYFCLTGQTLFGEGRAAQKLIWAQTRQPKPIRSLRPEVPEGLAAIIEEKMLAKEASQRFQLPAEVCEALKPWTQEDIPPPPAEEMPQLSPAARRPSAPEGQAGPSTPGKVRPPSPGPRKAWAVTGASSTQAAVRSGAPTVVPLPVPSAETSIRGTEAAPSTPSGTGIGAEKDNGQPPEAADAPPRPEKSAARPTRFSRTVWLVAAGVAVLAVASVGTWWALTGGHGTPSTPDRQTARVPAPKARPGPESKPESKPVVKPPAPPVQGVSIVVEKDGRRVRTPKYEALVGADGNLTSLRVGGVEFLKSGLKFGGNVSRGGYFHYTHEKPARVVSLPTLEQLGGSVLKATGDRFTIVYEFGLNSLTLKLTNATDFQVPFYLVFDRKVTGVINERGEAARTPVVKPWPITSWFAGRVKLTVTGGNRIWGPWPSLKEGYQVWEASLATYETREVLLTVGTATDAEFARVGPPPDNGGAIQIKKPAYEAVVEADGCLTSLSVEGVEFLRSGVDIPRGVYFHDGKGVVKLGNVRRPSPDVIVAKGERASVRYEFGPDNVTVNATNTTDKGLAFFIVFDPAVNAVVDGAGAWAKAPLVLKQGPAEKKWETTTWFAGGARLKITGGSRLWGPWLAEKLQVWEASLAPKETRRVVLSAGLATDAEAKQVAAVTGKPVVRTGLLVRSPKDYQVFQRRSRFQGQIVLRGQVRPDCDRLEVRLTGRPLAGALPSGWLPVPLGKGTRDFEHSLPVPAGGWYKVELRALKGEKVVAETVVEHVGVGEVFVGAGQSNSTNCGPERLKQESGMVATFDGRRWRPGDDPQPGVHDHSSGGSYFPAFGDALYAKYHVPIGVASVGHSGTSVKQWEPGGELFGWLMTRIRQLGPNGFRAVQWHQGESDVGMSADEYARRLTEVIQESNREAGWKFPWMVARVSYHNPQHSTFPTTREAQKRLWDMGVALEGPDTDTLTGDNRDQGGRGIHFSARGLRAHGRMWADKVGAYLDKVLMD